jgi:gamma-glutamyl-gamma-aminobutyrate hydrolase PuuD|tara:strand:- start:5521 stop:6069 length:549 start_codon:yes stop_codon:yes gene_type:complete
LKIGLSQRILFHKGRAYDATEHGWYSYLSQHTLTFVANNINQDFEQIASDLDCLILTGGDDSSIRRITETKLAGCMLQCNKPVIGICHGALLLTDLLGGTIELINDHHSCDHPISYQNKEVTVNSYHNLSIKSIHSSATLLAKDNAGNCEAWIDGKLAGVMWHPERMSIPWLPTEINNLLSQ